MKCLESAEHEVDEAKEAYERDLNRLEHELTEAHARMRCEFAKELENFEEENDVHFPPFTKTFSSDLQNLRETQRLLIPTKRYADG
jgi:hypothetical protein